ncbi:unnamed protein product, partial [Prorocentrum cordatum]
GLRGTRARRTRAFADGRPPRPRAHARGPGLRAARPARRLPARAGPAGPRPPARRPGPGRLGGRGLRGGAARGRGEVEGDYFILPELPGPFEVDPKEAIIVGDADAPQAKKAKDTVVKSLKEAEEVLAKLQEDPQADVSYAVQEFGIADLRVATNTINNLMDEATAAGTQRLQRLMIHNKYLYEDELPFPVSKKGVVQKRGPARLARIEESLKR